MVKTFNMIWKEKRAMTSEEAKHGFSIQHLHGDSINRFNRSI